MTAAPPRVPSHAMVLAAGLGTRMRPITLTLPKPLVRAAGRTLLDWALDRLEEAGVTRAVVNTHHLGEQIEAHLKNHSRPAITCVAEDPILETGGGVQNALPHLGDAPFFVCNADNLWLDGKNEPSALTRLAAAWDDARMDALLLLYDPACALGYDGPGDFTIDDGGRLTRRREGDADALVFTGVQILHPRLFDGAPGGVYSLNRLYDRALAAGRLYGLAHTGAWFHVGTPEALAETDTRLRALGYGA